MKRTAQERKAAFAKRRKTGSTVVLPYARNLGRSAFPAELKFFDTSKVSTTVSATGTILNNCLNIVPEGNGQSARNGRKILIKKISIRGSFELADDETTDRVRLVIYQDKQANGAAATIANIFSGTDINSFNEIANKGRFRILKEITADLNPATYWDGTDPHVGGYKVGYKANLRCNIPIEFDDSVTTGALTSVTSNNLGVAAFSQVSSANATYTVRIRYLD